MAQSWDKIFLIVMLVAIAILAGVLGYTFSSRVEAVLAASNRPQSKSVKALIEGDYKAENKLLLQPSLWDVDPDAHQLFVGRKFLYFSQDKVVKLYEPSLIIDGLPVEWLEKYNLPISDVHVADRDPDGDGFTNIEEYRAGTNPLDINSHPFYIQLMRMKVFTSQKFRFKFQDKSELDGEDVFQVSTADDPAKHTRFVKSGDEINEYKVLTYEHKTKEPEPPDFQTDVSELTILNEKTGDKVVLVMNREKDVPEISASFVLLIPGLVDQAVEVKIGDPFSISVPMGSDQKPVENKYKLVRATADSATILDLQQNKEVTVPLMKDSDLDQMPKSP